MLFCGLTCNQEVIKGSLYEIKSASFREFQLNPSTLRRLNLVVINVKCSLKTEPLNKIRESIHVKGGHLLL